MAKAKIATEGAGPIAAGVESDLRQALRELARLLLDATLLTALPGTWRPPLHELAAFAAAPDQTSGRGRFTQLVERLTLSTAESLLLVAAISPDLDLSFRKLWQIIGDRSDFVRPRVAGLAALLSPAGEAGRALALLDPAHALRAFGLVELLPVRDGAAADSSVAPTSGLATYLAGCHPAGLLAGVELLPDGEPLPEALPADIDGAKLFAGLRALFGSGRRATIDDPTPIALCIDGPAGSGRGSLAQAIAHSLGLAIASLPLGPTTPPSAIGDLLRAALLLPALPCIELADARNEQLSPALALIARQYRGPLLILTDGRLPLPSPWRSLVISLTAPDVTLRARLFRHATGKGVADATLNDLARRFPLGRSGIRRATLDAEARSRLRGVRTDAASYAQAARDQLDARSPLSERIRPSRRLDDLVAPAETLALIDEILAFARHRREVVDRWGFNVQRGFRAGLKVLFTGTPGTGKSMSAEIIAAELDLDLFRIDLSMVVSKWIGETEKNLRQLFDQAEATGGILLFDEADALFGRRTSDTKTSTDRYANMEVNYLLQRMEAYDGIVILTTNFESGIDDAFRRRLNFRVRFSPPDLAERERLWRRMIPDTVPTDGTLDLHAVAQRYDMAGGHIRNAALRAAFLAAREGGPLATRHLLDAGEREFSEIGRIARGR